MNAQSLRFAALVLALGSGHAAKYQSRPSLTRLTRLSGGIDAVPSTDYEAPSKDEPVEVSEPFLASAAIFDAPTNTEKLLCEGVGTYILTLAVACVGAQQTALGPVAVAGVLIGLIYSFIKISGAVFNPAVSIALMMRGKMSLSTALQYTLVQTVAATLAGLSGFAIYSKSVAPTVAATGTKALLRAGFAEVLFTGVIVNAVCHAGTTRAQQDNDVVGLSLGLTVMGCAICSAYSGACFNPALGLGLQLAKAIVGGGLPIPEVALYLIAPSLGGALSTLIFKYATCPKEP